MAKKVAVLLSGCGVYDGTEIHEAVITLLALDRAGAEVLPVAPFGDQAQVVNHQTGEPATHEKRRIEVEAARLSRGPVRDISTLGSSDFDALIIPGGFGAAKNLCSYAFEGQELKVNAQVAKLLQETARAGKPIGALCIAPVLLAKVLAGAGVPVTVTIGTDHTTAGHIEGFGARHQPCAVDDVVVDRDHRVVTTPAYMLASSIKEAAAGIEKLVTAVLALC